MGEQRKPIDGLRDHAAELVSKTAELAQLVDTKRSTYTGDEPENPPVCQESREMPMGYIPQLAAYLQTISDYIVWIRRNIDQL